jgi:non-specific serine/threonine protein kinase
VRLVELAALADSAVVPWAVASAIGVPEEPGRPVSALLIAALRQRRVFVVLDNCEHLVNACARLADMLLRDCPAVTILASSREPLGVAGENLARLPPLHLPDEWRVRAPAALAEVEAVQLFVEGAHAVQPDFEVTAQNGAAVALVCRQLDGLPLAIDLAVARAGPLTPEHIARHMTDRFRLLTSGARTAVPRHRTLR